MGAVEKNLVKQAKRAGRPIPERIKNKPRLLTGLDIYLDAFFDLEHERPWIAGEVVIPLPISWTTMHTYAAAHGFIGEIYENFMFFMREMDSAYLQHLNKKARRG